MKNNEGEDVYKIVINHNEPEFSSRNLFRLKKYLEDKVYYFYLSYKDYCVYISPFGEERLEFESNAPIDEIMKSLEEFIVLREII